MVQVVFVVSPGRILVTGASGQLGGYLLRHLRDRGPNVVAWSGSRAGELFGVPWQAVDLTQPDLTAKAFRAARPDLVLHAAALASVAACHQQPDLARRVNVTGTEVLADLCAASGARLLLVSTDLVFDGERGGYREEDETRPLSVYGRSKRDAESVVLATPRGAVVRVSLLFGPGLHGRAGFFDEQVRSLREGRPVTAFADEWRTPLSLATAASALVEMLHADVAGLWHLGGPERLSRVEMVQALAAHLGVDATHIHAVSRSGVAAAEPRPRDTSLDSARWRSHFPAHPWPPFAEALRGLLPAG